MLITLLSEKAELQNSKQIFLSFWKENNKEKQKEREINRYVWKDISQSVTSAYLWAVRF